MHYDWVDIWKRRISSHSHSYFMKHSCFTWLMRHAILLIVGRSFIGYCWYDDIASRHCQKIILNINHKTSYQIYLVVIVILFHTILQNFCSRSCLTFSNNYCSFFQNAFNIFRSCQQTKTVNTTMESEDPEKGRQPSRNRIKSLQNRMLRLKQRIANFIFPRWVEIFWSKSIIWKPECWFFIHSTRFRGILISLQVIYKYIYKDIHT